MVRLAMALATAATVALPVPAAGARDVHHPAKPHHQATHSSGRHGSGEHHLASVEGSLASVDTTAGTAVLNVGRGRGARTVTLDLSSAKVLVFKAHGKPAVGQVTDLATADRVVAQLSVDGKTERSDVAAGTPLPVSVLRDHGQPRAPERGDSENAKIGGTVTAVSLPGVTVTTGDGPSAHTVTLDLSSASVFAGTPLAAADSSKVAVGDRVGALLSVTEDVAKSDVAAGTPLPVTALYDIGPRPVLTPDPAPTPPPPGARYGGHVSAISGNLVTLSFGDAPNVETVTLDVSAAQVLAGQPLAAADVSALHVGDVVTGRLSVSSDVAESDVASSTPLPVASLYDLGPAPVSSPAAS